MKSDIYFATLELRETFLKLKDDDHNLFKKICKTMDCVRQDCFCGIQIRKRLIPMDYVQKYGIDNLWKVNLSHDWRLLYSITNKREILVVAVIIDWMHHKDYERKFKY